MSVRGGEMGRIESRVESAAGVLLAEDLALFAPSGKKTDGEDLAVLAGLF